MFQLKESSVFKRGVAPLLGAMAIVALVAFGGCGGDDESTTSASTPAVTVESSSLSKAEYAKQANEICSKGTAKVEGLVRKAIVTGKGVAKVEAAFFPVIDGWVTEIQALGAPKGEEAEVEAFLTALKQDLEEVEAKSGNSLEQLAIAFKESGNLARKTGLASCALG
jgi:ABC-type Fe3+-hydroxamate transport system substrate-binding protein